MESFVNVTPEDIKKRFANAKDHQPVELAYMAPIKASKEFKTFLEEHGAEGQYMVKISRLHTVTNCKFSELPYVIADREEKAAKIAAGEIEAKEPKESPYNTIIPNILKEKDGQYYFYTYPREYQKYEPGTAYCIMNPDGTIFAEYDSIEPLRPYIQPSYFNTGKVDTSTGEILPQPIKQWKLDRMYEVWPE